MVAVSDMERLFPTSRQEGGDHYKKHSIQPYTFITKNNLSFSREMLLNMLLDTKTKTVLKI
jgi:hypothetical protein